MCVWAGTVRVLARLISGLGETRQEFKLGESVTTEAENVTLTEISPRPKAGIKIEPGEYVFRFEIAKRNAAGSGPPPPPASGGQEGIRGNVLLGPICPVERAPPNPQCADRPYQTRLAVTTVDQARVIKEFGSDAKGIFSIELPPGEYAIRSVANANILPRCGSTGPITVKTSAYTEATVYCDTGIR